MNHKSKIKVLLLSLLVLQIGNIQAIVKMPQIFDNNMVLQRDRVVNIWGWADKGETVEVAFNGQKKKAKADKKGYWQIELSPMAFGGPFTMTVKGKSNGLALNNILIGDVWVCSGQSNMEWNVANSNNALEEIRNANHSTIRSFNVQKNISTIPLHDLEGAWEVCSPETVGKFSAVGYFFARKLNQELNIPIGIINSSWGGTDIEPWTSPEAFDVLSDQFKKRYTGSGMSFSNLKGAIDENAKAKAVYLEALKADAGLKEEWFKPTTNTSDWKTMDIPQEWSTTEFASVDGIVWFRYDFKLGEEANQKAKLHLGDIDDHDITWVNGIKIGETKLFGIARNYDVPGGTFKEGLNTLVIRVQDNAGGGGICSRADDLFIEVGNKRIPLAAKWSYKKSVISSDYNYRDIGPNSAPSLLFNAMINPIVDYGIKGAIWYQGENNANEAYNYRTLFPAMIEDWRNKFGHEFPFYWVQLANFMQKEAEPRRSQWAELREAQNMTLSLPKTGQAVITDIGDAFDIHPRNKQDVGLRLALNALNKDYGKRDLVFSGPTYGCMSIEGEKVIVNMANIDGGLVVRNKYGYIEGFAVAGADKKFYWAKAYVKDDQIVVYSDEVKNPVAVRYSWSDNPDVNLFNKAGLPAAPFRSDDWQD